MDQEIAGFGGFDNGIYITKSCGYVRVCEFLTISVDQFFTGFFGIFRCFYFVPEDDIGGSFGSHDCDFGSRPCEYKVGPEMMGTHGNVSSTVSFAEDNG